MLLKYNMISVGLQQNYHTKLSNKFDREHFGFRQFEHIVQSTCKA